MGKVLIDFDFLPAIQKLRQSVKLDMIEVVKLFNNSDLAERWDKGLLTGREFFGEIQKQIELPIDLKKFIQIWNDIFTEKEEMISLAKLLNKNYKVILLSNTNPWHASHIRKTYPWTLKFDGFIASCDVQMLKPDSSIFKLTLKKGRVQPQESFYVDDKSEFIDAAKSLGIDAVVFKNHKKLLKELEKREILP